MKGAPGRPFGFDLSFDGGIHVNVQPTSLPGVFLLEPRVFSDPRGTFFELFQNKRFADAGLPTTFVQDNVSFSERGTLRGLHLQNPFAQGKLVSVLEGEVFDVAVDVRVGSPTFGRWVGELLSSTNHRQLYIPPGFAHGFCVTSARCIFQYKCTDIYAPSAELGVIWNDPDLGITWPVEAPLLSAKDERYPRLAEIPPDKLPRYVAP